MNQEANEIVTKVFRTLIVRHAEIGIFRHLVNEGLRHAMPHIAADSFKASLQYFENPANDAVFVDKPAFLEWVGGVSGFAEKTTTASVDTAKRSVDDASLVFMHSALDGAAQDLCRVTALVALTDWEPFVKDRKLGLSEVKATPYESLLKQRVNEHLKTLERESLLKRIDRLFQVCQPPANFTFIKGYTFDRTRVEKLDEARHAIIHGNRAALYNIDESLQFLLDTGLYLIGLTFHRYSLKLDAVAFMKQWTKAIQ